MTEELPSRFIDAHHHLWDLRNMRYPWLQDGPPIEEDTSGLAPIRRDYLPCDFRSDTAWLPLVASVHVEAAHDPESPVRETQWLDRTAAHERVPTVIVAFARLEDPGLEELLDAHARSPRLRGIRQMLNWEPQERVAERPDLLTDARWESGLALLAERGLVFDLQVFPSQLQQAADVVARNSDVTFVLDHGGYLQPRNPKRSRVWRDGIRQLAESPNVFVKASSFASVDPAYAASGLRSFLDELREVFGPNRVMFGSNFPVDRRFIGYREQVEAHAAVTRGWGERDRDRYFFANAADVYRIESDAG